MQFYLLKPIDDICKKYIARFRMSSHCLNIEHGRYRNELRENRLCTFCNQNDIEDEFYFILKQNRSTEECSKLKRSVDMTSSGKNGLNIRTNASPKWDRTRCPEE